MDWDWEKWPVIFIQFGHEKYDLPGKLEEVLDKTFRELEKRYDITDIPSSYSGRLWTIIRKAHEKTGKRVVILIDDYDKPMVDNLQNKEVCESYYNFLGGIYGNLKSSAEYLELTFVTGTYQVWQFGSMPELNHLYNISDSYEAAGLCGFTQEEILTYLREGTDRFASSHGLSREEAVQVLKDNYGGYRFSHEDIEVFNPWSILNALLHTEVRYYWNETGMPSEVKASLKSLNPEALIELDDIPSRLRFSPLFARYGNDLVGILYLNGYLTIKYYDFEYNDFCLGIPDKEVREAISNIVEVRS